MKYALAGSSACSVPASLEQQHVTTSGPSNVPPRSSSGTVRVASRGGCKVVVNASFQMLDRSSVR